MTRTVFTFVVFAVAFSPALAAAAETPTEQYQTLLNEFEQQGGARIFAKRFLKHAQQHPDDETAVDALLWIVENVPGRPETTTALDMLAADHAKNEKLASACSAIASSRSLSGEKLLRKMSREHPQVQVRTGASYFLAQLLELQTQVLRQLQSQPELARRVVQYYGKPYGEHLVSLSEDALAKRKETLYERILKTFPDVEVQGAKLGEIAQRQLFRIRHLSVGTVAPEIKGEDIHGEEFKLSDYRGNVVMLTFWGHW